MKLSEVIELILSCRKQKSCTNEIANEAHNKAEALGWFSKKEFPAPYRNRNGRIDLFVNSDGKSAGIEVDRKSFKKKSIEKLRLLDVSYRILVVADEDVKFVPSGIDAVISISHRTFITAK